MKKIAINFLAVLFISALSFTKAFAVDMTLGVSGAIVNLQAEGSETETGSQTAETTPASVSNTFATGSIFAEAQFGKIAFGGYSSWGFAQCHCNQNACIAMSGFLTRG